MLRLTQEGCAIAHLPINVDLIDKGWVVIQNILHYVGVVVHGCQVQWCHPSIIAQVQRGMLVKQVLKDTAIAGTCSLGPEASMRMRGSAGWYCVRMVVSVPAYHV